jgi:uncharacterized protein
MPVHRTPRLDPRNPLVIDTRELGRRPGSMRRITRTVPAPAGLALELIGIPVGAPLELDLRLEAVMEGVLISGTVSGRATGECGRCLEPVSEEVDFDLQELYAYPDSATQETTSEDEAGRIEGDLIDLEPAVRDTVVLGLPLSPLCRDDCRGLCATCGTRWDDLPPDHSHERTDPRWAALVEQFGEHRPDSQEN